MNLLDYLVKTVTNPRTQQPQANQSTMQQLQADVQSFITGDGHRVATAETYGPKIYVITDTRTGKKVGGTYTNMSRAKLRADKLDNEWGAYRYQASRVWGEADEPVDIKNE